MMTKTSLAVALPFLVLAACGGEPQRDSVAQPEPAASTATSSVETPAAATTDVASKTVPAAFHGVWDAESGTCDPASDLRLEIGPQTIGFYESQGTVRQATETVDGQTVIALAMEGEGETWDQALKLKLEGSGEAERLLSLPVSDNDAARSPIPLKRCPA